MVGDFIAGAELSRRFYLDAVLPVLRQELPGLVHAAALIGGGSEVLGFDTERSTDHNWGPRVQLFLGERDFREHGAAIPELLAERLPRIFLGFPTNLEPVGAGGALHMRMGSGPLHHGVVVAELGDWLTRHLGFDPLGEVTDFDWLATPAQTLAEVTRGAVFHDGSGLLNRVRERLTWYPDDLWRYLLACQWQRISQEEAFTGRCGEVGDEVGSAVVAGRLVRDLMRLCLLMKRRYPPYAKWLGSAFAQLPVAAELTPVFTAALAATSWRDREHHLATACEAVAAMHNDLGLTEEIDPRTRPYHERPFQVLHAERFAHALRESISGDAVRALPLVGSVDQFLDSTDVLCDHERRRAAAHAVYEPERAETAAR
ncbi:protein of unknown function [Saccharopolyspora kobensis]|uniref:DUF4037 domain-containing protein n=1 Tax=Saccharopolyspora kobensis TaxID=146035 RepID=A0A1H6CUX9_9PSEU|nr:protein of unknown function [Saccharopolyspora kobensis]SFD00484.1 protein of unknown function [Saccharopolyspora kobensis]